MFARLLVSLSFVASPALAQEAFPDGYVRTVTLDRPLVKATYSLELDRVVEAPSLAERMAAPCFDNSAIYLPDTYVVTNTGEEILNWGTKSCQAGRKLRSMTIRYLTEAVDPSVGGPGATVSIALYRNTLGFGEPGTRIFRRTLSGLPGNIPGMSILGGVELRIDFGTSPLPLPDGRIGWSFLQLDGDTGPMLVNAPNATLGTLDAMDIYSPGPASRQTYVGTFRYPLCTCANTFVQLEEISAGELASATVVNGNDVNPVLFEQIFPAQLGETWAGRIDVPVPPAGFGGFRQPYTYLLVSASTLATPRVTPWGERLVDMRQSLSPLIPGEAGYIYAIPASAALVGTEVVMQALVTPDALPTWTYTNALRVRIGY